MKNQAITLTIIFFVSAICVIQSVNAQQSIQDQYFAVHEYSGGFRTYMPICSFNASIGNCVGIDLSTSGVDTSGGKGGYGMVEVQVVSSKSGVVYDKTASSFSETFQLNQDDTYNVTLIKQNPFYDDLTVTGQIALYYHTVPLSKINPTPSVTITATMEPTTNPTASPTTNLAVNPSPSVPEMSWFAILPLLLSMFSVVMVLRLRRVKKV
jgi:hypothetical protein